MKIFLLIFICVPATSQFQAYAQRQVLFQTLLRLSQITKCPFLYQKEFLHDLKLIKIIREKYCNNLSHIHGGNTEMYIQNNLWRNRVHQVIPYIHTIIPLSPRGFLLRFKLGAAVTKSLFFLTYILVLIPGCKDRGQTEQWEANSEQQRHSLNNWQNRDESGM